MATSNTITLPSGAIAIHPLYCKISLAIRPGMIIRKIGARREYSKGLVALRRK